MGPADAHGGGPVILRSAADSDDPMDAVYSLIDTVNAQFEALLDEDEVGEAALAPYVVDFYVAQVCNGGHSQFLFNSRGASDARIDAALRALGHREGLAVWTDYRAAVGALSPEQLRAFLDEDYLDADGFHPLDALEDLDDRLMEVSDDLTETNARALLADPDLVVLPDDELEAWVTARAAQIPDLDARRAAAAEAEPSYLKAARAYCAERGLTFDRVTAGAPFAVDGQMAIRWHFLTTDAHFTLVERPDGSVDIAPAD